MAGEYDQTSDTLDETDVPETLVDVIRYKVSDYLKKTKDISVKIRHAPGKSPTLILSFGNKNRETRPSSSDSDTTTILVNNVPASADEDLLEVFFESKKKYGGGPVKHVKIIREQNYAFVEFHEASAVETVLKKKPIMLGLTELSIKPYKTLLPGSEVITSVDMTGLPVPKYFTETLLQNYLNTIPMYGPELAAMIKVGSRVVRGRDWTYGDKDGHGEGTVIEKPSKYHVYGTDTFKARQGMVTVQWDDGKSFFCRMGAENCYDLKLAYV